MATIFSSEMLAICDFYDLLSHPSPLRPLERLRKQLLVCRHICRNKESQGWVHPRQVPAFFHVRKMVIPLITLSHFFATMCDEAQIRSELDSPPSSPRSNRHLGRWLASTHPLEPSPPPPQPPLLLKNAQEHFDVWATFSPRHRPHDLSPPTSPRLRVGEAEDALPLPLRRQAPPLFVSPQRSEGATSSSEGKRKEKERWRDSNRPFAA